MIFRCRIDGLLLPAEFVGGNLVMLWDGDESFTLELAEAGYYEVIEATPVERSKLIAKYRMMRVADGSFVCNED